MLKTDGGKSTEEIEKFRKILRETAGIWKGESGYKFIRKIRKSSEKRAKRLGI